LLVGKLIVVLSCSPLDVDMSGVGSRLLLLLVSLLLIGEELHSCLGWRGPHCDRRNGLESRSVLRHWHSGDGVTWSHHVAPSGVRESRAPPPPLSPLVALSSSEDSLRAVCRDGDPSYTIPMKMELESHSWGEILRWPRRSTVNSRLPKRMVLPRARPMSVGLLPLAMKESFGEGTIRISKGKAHCKSPFLVHQLLVFFHQQEQGGQDHMF
jgi:hypothetical protein